MITADYRSTLQRAWDLVPYEKLKTTAKVAFVALVLYHIYKLYKVIKTLEDRVQTLEKTVKDLQNKQNDHETTLYAVKEEITNTVAPLLWGANTSIPSLPISPIPTKSHLDKLAEEFPGKNLACSYTRDDKTIDTNFGDFLLFTFLRMEEKPSCAYDEASNTYTLKYREGKIITISELPQSIWDNAKAKSYFLYVAIAGLLKIQPQLQFTQELQVQILRGEEETTISILNQSIFLVPKFGYTGHVKQIVIPHNADEKVFIQSDHNLAYKEYGGHLEHQTIVETVAPFFFSKQ